ncbi:hypothetical protein ACHQM5_027271 [Ranunculus cassubicifolius]
MEAFRNYTQPKWRICGCESSTLSKKSLSRNSFIYTTLLCSKLSSPSAHYSQTPITMDSMKASFHHCLPQHSDVSIIHRMQSSMIHLAEDISDLVVREISKNNQPLHSKLDLLQKLTAIEATPLPSPRIEISENWREFHGATDYSNLLDPLHPVLRKELIKYGEFAQATYDAFDFDPVSEYCGSCRYNPRKFFDEVGLSDSGYVITKYIYAMYHVDVPSWLKMSSQINKWSKSSNWMGFIAVSDDVESQRIGRRDICVSWRGTKTPSEMYGDIQSTLEPIGYGCSQVKAEYGFLHIYTSKDEGCRYNKKSASEQVMQEIQRLVNLYRKKGEEVSLTITGHSLGGALAILNAYEVGYTVSDLPIHVISFGAPRVGNVAFRDELNKMGVKTLRIVVKQDFVPKLPGTILNEGLKKFEVLKEELSWFYIHVGHELKLSVKSSPFLKHGFNNSLGFHSLQTYLHLLDGYVSPLLPFGPNARRDVALVNKGCGMLRDELKIPKAWYQMEHKGLVRNAYGRWVKRTRNPEDIPTDQGEEVIL